MAQINLNKLPDNSVEILVKVPWEEVEKEYQKALEELQKEATLPGFRKGKAPKAQVEKSIGKEKIYQEVIEQLIPRLYQEALTSQKINPIISPKVELIAAQEGKDWEIKFTTAEKPTVSLGNYQEEIKKINTKGKIWTPESEEKKTPEEKEKEEREKLDQIIETILKASQVTLPAILFENDVNQKLAGLIEKTEKLGLTLEQYLASLGKTAAEIRREYEEESRRNWQLELVLAKIADEEKITVSDEEINQFIAKTPQSDQKALEQQRYLIAAMLRQQKTLNFLKNL
jgi:FKBP-type peptidyl-prolyl cis-trans isomerase (trigger factor)